MEAVDIATILYVWFCGVQRYSLWRVNQNWTR